MNNAQFSETSTTNSANGKSPREMRERTTEAIQRLLERLRNLLRLVRGSPHSGSRPPEEAGAEPGAPPDEDQLAADYGLWWNRRGEYPGDRYPNFRTRRTMRSGAWMWIRHALANGVDPAQADWAAVEEMFAASSLEESTKNSYRSYITWWFAWCRTNQAEWAESGPSAEDAG